MRILVLLACPASSSGKDLGAEMDARVRQVGIILQKDNNLHVLFAEGASGYQPNELYGRDVRSRLVGMHISAERIHSTGMTASTVGEVEVFEKFLLENKNFSQVLVASPRYQIYRARFIFWWKYRRSTVPVYLSMKGVPWGYLLVRSLMEFVKFPLYFFLSKGTQDDVNKKILGPHGL